MPSIGERPPPARPATVSRRRVLGVLVGLPFSLAVVGCTGPVGQPEPSGSMAGTTGSSGSAGTPTTPPPPPDTPALSATASAALVLLAAYEATAAAHPTLAPVLAPYAADHATHLEALGGWIEVPTPSPTTSAPATSTSAGTTPPAVPLVPADPAAARAALIQAETVAGDAAIASARSARDGEAARLLASIGASRTVHALLLEASA